MTTFVYAVTATVLLAIALGACRVLRVAAARHFVLATTFVAVLLLPMLSALMIRTPVVVRQVATITVSAQDVVPAMVTGPARKNGNSAPNVLWAVLIAGQVLALLRVLRHMRRRKTAPSPAQPTADRIAQSLGIRRQVRVVESDAIAIPETHGVLRPTVTLPAVAQSWPADRVRVVLLHELMHVRRNDWMAGAIAEVAAALHWFNPLAWIAVRQMAKQRELACDDAVLAHGVDGCDYASHLLDVVAGVKTSGCAASVAMAEMSQLETRIRSILDGRVKQGGTTMFSKLSIAAGTAVLLVSMAAVNAAAQGGVAALSGTVLDASSARVPQASVIVKNAETGAKEIVRSGETGDFSLPALPAGTYDVEVAKRGFQLFRQERVTLAPGSAQNISVVLNVGRLNENIDVVGQRMNPKPEPVRAAAPQRLRIGGDVQAAKMVKMTRPAYPPQMKAAGIEGTVMLEAVISRDGKVASVKPLNTLVHPDLTQAAMDAVREWQYEPTYLNGEPVEIVTAVNVNYTLK